MVITSSIEHQPDKPAHMIFIKISISESFSYELYFDARTINREELVYFVQRNIGHNRNSNMRTTSSELVLGKKSSMICTKKYYTISTLSHWNEMYGTIEFVESTISDESSSKFKFPFSENLLKTFEDLLDEYDSLIK